MNDYSSSFPGVDAEFQEASGIPNMTGTPERRLLLAILERAILDFVGNEPKEIEEAERWLFGDLDHPGANQFSFAWVCEQLDLDPYKIANKVRSMPRRGNRKVAPWYFQKSAANA